MKIQSNILLITMAITIASVPPLSHANDVYTSCSIEVAISSPPITTTQYVVFNVNSDRGTSRSVTLKGGSAPNTFANLICSSMPYNISATLYTYPNSTLSQTVGQCVLKSGPVVLNEAYNSISVVFPNDFDCSSTA